MTAHRTKRGAGASGTVVFGCRNNLFPDLADVPDPADVRCRAVGLDLQSRPIEYKDLQSATTIVHFDGESAQN